MKIPFLLVAIAACTFCAGPLYASVSLPSIYGSHMVLQREVPDSIRGQAAPGQTVTVTLSKDGSKSAWQQRIVADANGAWTANVPATKAGGTYTMTFSADNTVTLTDVVFGEVWVCSGQSNMDFSMADLAAPSNDSVEGQLAKSIQDEIATAHDDDLRQFKVPYLTSFDKPGNDIDSSWVASSPATNATFSGTGYYYARVLRKELGVPVGLIKAAWGGTPIEPWVRPELLNRTLGTRQLVDMWAKQAVDFEHSDANIAYQAQLTAWKVAKAQADADNKQAPAAPKPPVRPQDNWYWPGTIYNGMIAPLTHYTIRGVIWYQGEGNAGKYGLTDIYSTTFAALIQDWRKQWGQGDFPFLFVQLSSLGDPPASPGEDFFAEIRDEQRKTLAVPNTGMAVTIDIGCSASVHPKNKLEVGRRLALWALAKTYKKHVPVYSGPLYKASRIDGNRIIITFSCVGSGLMTGKKIGQAPTSAVDGDVKWCQIAGDDKKWVWAKGQITGKDEITVSSDDVPHPVAVRYAWLSEPAAPNLYNKEGLPASPFRTDDWPFVNGMHF